MSDVNVVPSEGDPKGLTLGPACLSAEILYHCNQLPDLIERAELDNGLVWYVKRVPWSTDVLRELSFRMPERELQLEIDYRDYNGQAVALNGIVQQRLWDTSAVSDCLERGHLLGELFRNRSDRSGTPPWVGMPCWGFQRCSTPHEENLEPDAGALAAFYDVDRAKIQLVHPESESTGCRSASTVIDWEVLPDHTVGDFRDVEEILGWMSHNDPGWPPCRPYLGYEIVVAPGGSSYVQLRGPKGGMAPLPFVVGHEISRLLKCFRRVNASEQEVNDDLRFWLRDAPNVDRVDVKNL